MGKPNVPDRQTRPKKDSFFQKAANVQGRKFTPKNDSFIKKSASGQHSGHSNSFFVKSSKPDRNQEAKDDKKSGSFFVQASSKAGSEQEEVQKKPFDKQKWRQNKYSLKTKVDKWKNQRVVHIRHGYFKEKNKSKATNFDVQKIYEEEEKRQEEEIPENRFVYNDNNVAHETTETDNFSQKTGKQRRKCVSKSVERDQAREEFLERKANKELALEKYRKKKIEKHKKLNKKTKKGQPVMRGRMELLLEQIQENMASENK